MMRTHLYNKMKKGIKIGLLGGIGPEATGHFYLKLIKRLQEEMLVKSNTDYPQIIINSIPAPELVHDKASKSDLEPYIKGLKELDSMKPEIIAMVCNTIHLYYRQLRREIKAPMINLREEVGKYLHRNNIKRITVLGTPMTIKNKLFAFDNVENYDITQREAEILSQAILNFNRGNYKYKSVVKRLIRKYLEMGAQKILLACTETSLMAEGASKDAIDTMNIMADRIANHYKATSFK